MATLLIFLPTLLYEEKCGYLQGVVYDFPEKKVKTVIVHGKLFETAENGNIRYAVWEKLDTVGYYYSNTDSNFYFVPRKTNWISVGVNYGEFFIKEALSNCLSVPLEECRLFVYNKSEFIKSELLVKQFDFVENPSDCFRTLTHSLEVLSKSAKSSSILFNIFKPFIIFLLRLFSLFLCYTTSAKPLLRFSTLGVHFHHLFKNICWVLSTVLVDKKLTLKTGNFIFALLADTIGGMIVLYYLVNAVSIQDVVNFICNTSEGVILSLRQLIEWLMGSPAGLKLNFPLNSVLGKFFIYHIDLWWSFLGLVRPFLEYSFYIFLLIGRLGFSFQIAILADFLAIASFHVYCIYVYAARLYNLQLRGLGSLSRLFIGCKRNPIPGKVDSCPYTTEQLFVGTIAFTVLLFLLPTTFVYYIVFAAMRLAVIGIGGILTRARFLLQSLPLYVLVLWFFNPVLTASSVQIIPKNIAGSLVFYVQPICGTLWSTVISCVPDTVEKPVSVKWGPLVRDVVTGRLIYPINLEAE
ncbi:phosphatidylinositol glycan anchor biosynthesis class Q isoform X2 [Lycorma delicatula]|uniref:phosphatidylinositol glycan anchor biosynthesis class Q isoform X2 n=1 Tax=Lycorma delicatula TaxID=130591 RepID=UPI003F51920E